MFKKAEPKYFILVEDEEHINPENIISLIIYDHSLIKKLGKTIKAFFKAKAVEIKDYGMAADNVLPIYFSAHITMKKIDFYKRFKLLPITAC